MRDQILSHSEMGVIEKTMLQRGMNFRVNENYSVILMSQRKGAPYIDKIHADGITIEYEGHNVPKNEAKVPQLVDQQRLTPRGKLSQNGKFVQAVKDFKAKRSEPEIVRIYEKLYKGIWSDKGFFKLLDYKYIKSGDRKVFRFILQETEVDFENNEMHVSKVKPRSRMIPTSVKIEVYKRDGAKCVICGATDELHYDHDFPYSKGGTSITADNVRILCARHNLQKSDKIE